ncbi:MAG: hypothetical protein HY519_02770 [Candidatus Aenigmarchaeota archaeon]|nr:hypothetical protein [Candidatus Aenigmarchaeota archaeon]
MNVGWDKMTEKLDGKRVGVALAAVAGSADLACAAAYALAPGATVAFFGNIFHGLELADIANAQVTLAGIAAGFVEITLVAFVLGWLFAAVYNRLPEASQ